jgi:dolichol kinase
MTTDDARTDAGDGPPVAQPTGRGELARKLIHVGASIIAVAVVWLTPPLTGRTMLACAVFIALAVEIARRLSGNVARGFLRSFGPLLRAHETHALTGATMLALGFLIAALLFPPHVAGVGMLYAGVGDAASALVGRRWGGLRFPWGKSVQGSAAFFVAAIAAGWVAPEIAFRPALAAALAATLFESLPTLIDDNLILPVVGALAAWAAVALIA